MGELIITDQEGDEDEKELIQMDDVDGGVSPPILLVLNLTQLKSCGIRLQERLSRV